MADQYAEFLRYFAKHHGRLFGYIYSLLPNRADAEDVFQRTSLVLWQKFDRYDPSEPFFPWACGVAFYEVRNFLRVSNRERLRFNSELLGKLAERDGGGSLRLRFPASTGPAGNAGMRSFSPRRSPRRRAARRR
jgi:RNA polymerase sigma factor (sigma-70 family)